jgi:hypothetical protein
VLIVIDGTTLMKERLIRMSGRSGAGELAEGEILA